MKIVNKFQMKIVNFRAVKNHCMLHGRVFVMIPYSHNRSTYKRSNQTDFRSRKTETSLYSHTLDISDNRIGVYKRHFKFKKVLHIILRLCAG